MQRVNLFFAVNLRVLLKLFLFIHTSVSTSVVGFYIIINMALPEKICKDETSIYSGSPLCQNA